MDFEVPIVGENGKYLPGVQLHPNKDYDVAAVRLVAKPEGDPWKSENLQRAITTSLALEGVSPITKDYLLTKENASESGYARIADEVFILGFPSAIYDVRNTSPIVRGGIISSSPETGYMFNPTIRSMFDLPDYLDGFLVDANLFTGSSGSLVVLRRRLNGGNINRPPTPCVIGIVSRSFIIDEKLGASQRIALGVVYSSTTIIQAINNVPGQNK